MAIDGDIQLDFGGIRSGVKAYVLGAYKVERPHDGRAPHALPTQRSYDARLSEAIELAKAIELDIVGAEIALIKKLRPATFVGKGKLEDILPILEAENVEVVFVDAALTPIQQRNLEKTLQAKVIDRTGLILEIFGRRARTKEGALQVELAHLTYQKSRLVRSWTHLERQRGGFGFLGGPGETQIEVDRRLIVERMRRIEEDLEAVRRTRSLHRSARKRVPYPVVALVGYTNAGKSTLFNKLTKADVLAADMLFATLDPTLRAVELPKGRKIILSDTVGFVSDLPTILVAAFRSTLEEVVQADIIVHVRDCSHVDWEKQAQDVEHTLQSMDIRSDDYTRVIEVWNKIDLLEPSEKIILTEKAKLKTSQPILTSALNGEGLENLLTRIEAYFARQTQTFDLQIDATNGQLLAWIYRNGDVLERLDQNEFIHIQVRFSPEKHSKAILLGALHR